MVTHLLRTNLPECHPFQLAHAFALQKKSAFLRVLKMQGDEKKELRGCNLEVRVLPNDAE